MLVFAQRFCMNTNILIFPQLQFNSPVNKFLLLYIYRKYWNVRREEHHRRRSQHPEPPLALLCPATLPLLIWTRAASRVPDWCPASCSSTTFDFLNIPQVNNMIFPPVVINKLKYYLITSFKTLFV